MGRTAPCCAPNSAKRYPRPASTGAWISITTASLRSAITASGLISTSSTSSRREHETHCSSCPASNGCRNHTDAGGDRRPFVLLERGGCRQQFYIDCSRDGPGRRQPGGLWDESFSIQRIQSCLPQRRGESRIE